MAQLQNVTVDKAANVYFEGKVTSRTVWLQDGSKVTLGIMLPGTYEFGTDSAEMMEILSGELKVLLPGQAEWTEIRGQGTFEVPAHSSFQVEVRAVTDYLCSYSNQ